MGIGPGKKWSLAGPGQRHDTCRLTLHQRFDQPELAKGPPDFSVHIRRLGVNPLDTQFHEFTLQTLLQQVQPRFGLIVEKNAIVVRVRWHGQERMGLDHNGQEILAYTKSVAGFSSKVLTVERYAAAMAPSTTR